MRRIVAAFMILAAPAALAYTADELAQKNVEAEGRDRKASRHPVAATSPASFWSTADASSSLCHAHQAAAVDSLRGASCRA